MTENSFNALARPELYNIRKIMDFYENPQDTLKTIHVAGTNGKGSVCAYLQSILTENGYKTGKFSSPHMLEEYERISIDGKNIDKSEFCELMSSVKSACEKIFKDNNIAPTQFELWTAVAFLYFKKNNCDYVILETGLGGRLDATNIIKKPVFSIITKIDLDHTQLLGNSIEEIAKEKSGIIKNNSRTLIIDQNDKVLEVIKKEAQKKENSINIITPPSSSDFIDNLEVFDYCDINGIKSTMLGDFQKENASLAISCALMLGINHSVIKKGILKAKNSGRFEVISQNPYIIFDGAHNKNGMNALAKSLDKYFKDKDFNFIVGFMSDKDISSSLDELKPIKNRITFYPVTVKNNARSTKSDILCDILKNKGYTSIDARTIENALSIMDFKNKITVICGSLYLYNDYFTLFSKGN